METMIPVLIGSVCGLLIGMAARAYLRDPHPEESCRHCGDDLDPLSDRLRAMVRKRGKEVDSPPFCSFECMYDWGKKTGIDVEPPRLSHHLTDVPEKRPGRVA